jgi:hypothetical protein
MYIFRENLEALKNKVGATNKSIGDGIGRSERTIARVFSKKAEDHKRGHSMNLIEEIVEFLGGNMSEIFEDSSARIVGKSYLELQEKLDSVTDERDALLNDVKTLAEEVNRLSKELVEVELKYTKKLIETHDYYNKLVKD